MIQLPRIEPMMLWLYAGVLGLLVLASLIGFVLARRVSDLYIVWQALAANAHGSMESMFSRRWADSDLESWIDAYGLNKKRSWQRVWMNAFSFR